ncbi:MAG: helix-turn-helix transcriptional regulator [Pseudomonadota bacterium]
MNQPHRIPESMSPRDIGAYMANLRAQFNLTQQEVSERLHIRPRYVSAIEEGRFELMPGQVYARGYIHTYAEFLGLDAEHVTAQCFTGAAPAPVAPSQAFTPRPNDHGLGSTRNWRGLGMAAVVALLAVLVFTQISGTTKEPQLQEPAVAPVPEAMLQSVRNLVMPTPQNLDCLTGEGLLTCFYDDNVMRLVNRIENDTYFMDDIDLSGMALAAPEEPAAEPATPAPASTEE